VPRILTVDDPQDPRVAAFWAVRERDLVGRDGRFMAEGEVVLRVLLTRSRFPVEAILLSDQRYPALAGLIAPLSDDLPVYVAPQAVMSRIVGFPIHRGVLAVGRCEAPTPLAAHLESLPSDALILGAVGIANHDNIGGIFRNAAAFGAAAVLLDAASCNPLYRKAIRVSVGASLIVPFAVTDSAAAMVAALEEAGFRILALSPRGDAPLGSLRREGRTALLLGAEGPGLPDALLRRSMSVRIPMAPDFDSLNVATASGIALHHLRSR
jgi:tRNA G18 (ribose-2'-O)-methylase SpoU